jgi:hypothetical protein
MAQSDPLPGAATNRGFAPAQFMAGQKPSFQAGCFPAAYFTGTIACSYGVLGHIMYGLVGSGSAVRG